MEHEALKRSRVHPGRAGPVGPTQPPGRAPAWASGPTSSEGAVPVPGPEEAGAHPSARTPLRARGWGGEATPCWARRPRGGERGGDDRADPPAGNAKADPAGIAYTDQPLGGGACSGRGRRKEGGSRGLPACLFWYQHRVSLSPRVPEEKRWTLPDGVCAQACGRGLRAPGTSARSAWRSCRTAPGRPATSWKRPR